MSADPEKERMPTGRVEALAAEFEALRPGTGYAAEAAKDKADEAALFRKADGESQPFSALCISGGGIRSATFALGAIQGLADPRRGILEKFDYLSTVSGGGYIGGWLSAWSKRAGGLKNLIDRLRPDAKPGAPGQPDPIRHLRDYNNYLSPKVGIMSADTWALAATVLRNILLNWMVLIPLLMAAFMVPRLFLSVLVLPEFLFSDAVFPLGDPNQPDYRAAALDAVSTHPGVQFIGLLSTLLFATAAFNTFRYLPGVGTADHTHSDYQFKVLLPLVGSVLVYLVFEAYYYLGSTYEEQTTLWQEILGRLIPCGLAWIAYLAVSRHPWRMRLRMLKLSAAIFVMAASTGAAAWYTVNVFEPKLSWPAYVTLGPPALVLGWVLGTVLFVGVSSRTLKDEDREWMSRSVGDMLMFCAAWTLVCGAILVAPSWVLDWKTWMPHVLTAVGAVSGWASAFGSSLMAKSAPAGAAKPGKARTAASIAIGAAPAIFIAALAVGLSFAANILLTGVHLLPGTGSFPVLEVLSVGGEAVNWQDHTAVLSRTSPALAATLIIALLALGWVMARYININTFSLHGMYRDRLIRAYLGASNDKRKANRFTGFAPNDNFAMHELDTGLKPFHVVNVTLNLVKANRLAWQQRKAQSFTITPLHCGNFELGYRPSASYGGPAGISLGTAVAISGAAASPSMGSQSSPVAGFIMTLLNARLGSWLGNPAAAGERTWRLAGPSSAIRSLVSEAFGLTSNQNPYIYLSDGGHFENLGLYEMVRRRCRFIVVLDAGCDPEFSYDDLGNALRKIRIDLGISIAFDDALMQPLRARKKRCAVAKIRYSGVDAGAQDGWLIYVKPMRIGNEPPDVDNYGRTHPEFPHQSTNDQWFDESQTESYRMLGLSTIEDICDGWTGGSLDQLRRHVEDVYLNSGGKNKSAPAG